MKQTLEMLVELQKLDDGLRDLRAAKAQLEKTQAENAENLEIFDEMLAERAVRIAEVQGFCNEKVDEIKDSEEQTRKSRARMSHITSQRELTALNKELDSARRSNLQKTEELKKLKEELEGAETDHAQRQAQRDGLSTQMSELEAELVQRIKTREEEAETFGQKREALRAEIERPLVGRYDRISKARDGLAVADVINGTCEGCNMQVPPQVFQRLMRCNSLENCQHCHRILVFKEGFKAPEGDAAS